MKHNFYRSIAIGLVASATVLSAQAREFDSSTYLTGLFGYHFFDSERNLEDDPSLAIGLGHEFNRRFAAEVLFGGSDLEANETAVVEDINARFYRLDFLYHFAEDTWRPFVIAGAGNYEIETVGIKADETQYNLGLGMKHEISESMDLRFDARGVYSEDIEAKDAVLNLGINILFAGLVEPLQDEDGDGVLDDQDSCPGTAPGVKVDTEGCELDSDSDGVVDSADNCPNTPAGDEVDGVGCTVVVVAAVVVDGDGDGDGVKDSVDACLDTPKGAKVDAQGCTLQITETVTIKLNLNFPSNSAEISDLEMVEVEKLATFLREYPDTTVVVEGHTDSSGPDQYNQKLSERRALSVREAAIDRYGVAPDRITAVGVGESQPIADNATATGRQLNRRVVGVISATVTRPAE